MKHVTIVQSQGKHGAKIVQTDKWYMTRNQALAAAKKLLGTTRVWTEECFDVTTGVATLVMRRAVTRESRQ